MEPRRRRPPFKGYGVPESDDGMLPWSWATERLENARNYWVATTRPDGRPHSMPVWGIWLDGAIFFGSGRNSAKSRNLAANPAIVVHIENGPEVVIVEGIAEPVAALDPELSARLVEAFATKYEASFGYRPDPAQWERGGLYAVRPTVAFAWNTFPATTTRYRFGGNCA